MCRDKGGMKLGLSAVFKAIWGTDMEVAMRSPHPKLKCKQPLEIVEAKSDIEIMTAQAQALGEKLGISPDPVEQALEEIIKDL